MRKKLQIFLFFAFAILFLLLIFGTLYYHDFLKIWHIPKHGKYYLQSDMRTQAAGIINNYEFDSVILGSSMLENTSAKEASEILGGKFFNISLSGSSFDERSIILNYLFDRKDIKKVIYSLDYKNRFNFQTDLGYRYDKENYKYLYDDNKFNDIKAYLNFKYLRCIFMPKKCVGKSRNFDSPNEWMNDEFHFVRFGGLSKWIENKDNYQMKNDLNEIIKSTNDIKNNILFAFKPFSKIENLEKYLDENIIYFAKKYAKTEFILIIPPYSIINNALLVQYQKDYLENIYLGFQTLIKKSKPYSNIKIYTFWDMDFIKDISLYKDLTHYHSLINSKMLYWIKDDIGLLSDENFDDYWAKFKQTAKDYDLIEFSNTIEKFLDENQ